MIRLSSLRGFLPLLSLRLRSSQEEMRGKDPVQLKKVRECPIKCPYKRTSVFIVQILLIVILQILYIL